MTAATFQSTINVTLGFGIPGELIVDGPQRVDVLNLDSVGGYIGTAFTKSNTTNVASQGGTIASGVVFAGILVNPKVYASFGPVVGSPLDPTLFLSGYNTGEFLTMGTIVVNVTAAANIGDLVQYNTTTGVLSTVAPGASATTGNALIPNAVVWNYPTTSAGLVAIRITD
jgi:hypothetical protein